jgi:hypothetical protein
VAVHGPLRATWPVGRARAPVSRDTSGLCRRWHDQRTTNSRYVRRLAILSVAATLVAALATTPARGALFFLFEPTQVKPGDRVVVRLGGTPRGFDAGDRVKPFQEPVRLYLVPASAAGDVHFRSDPRLALVAMIVPDKNGHGVKTFTVPDLDDGEYVAAAWCPGCALYSRGRTFFTLPVNEDIIPSLRPRMVLDVEGSADSSGVSPLVFGLLGTALALAIGGLAVFILWRRGQASSVKSTAKASSRARP